MKKKYLLGVLIIAVCFVLVGCGSKKENDDDKKNDWVIDMTSNQEMLDEDILNIFMNANANYEGNLDYVALLGKQVVAGTNYMFLCKESGKYKVAVIYNNLENVSQITQVNDFDPLKYVNERFELNEENLAGGWYTERPGKPMMLDEKVQTAFDQATEYLTGASYYPIATLAHQEKSGTNYAVLCYGEGSYQGSKEGIYLLTLYVDETNKPEIVSIAAVDLKDYNK